MGPKNSTPVQNNQNLQIKINHPIFNNAKIVKNKEDQQLIETIVSLANKIQFDKWAKRVDDVPENDSLMIPIAKTFKAEGLCGSTGFANITYDNFPYLLSDQIQNRERLNKKLFQENQLWYLIYTLLSAAFTYHRQGAKVGDICPDNIFINEDGQVKVASVDSWPGQQTNYAKSFYEKEITYLSPQQIKDYQFGKMQQSVNKQLAQTFSIGLTCLDAATLSQSKSLYSKNFKFNYEKLESRIQKFKQFGYSEVIILTIQNMCQVDTEYRSTGRQILQWLLPNEEAIVNLEDFEVNGLPQKIILARQRDQSLKNQAFGINSVSQNLGYQGSSFGPNVYNIQPGFSVPSYTQPIQKVYYQPPPGTNIVNSTGNVQVINQPSSYQVTNLQYPIANSLQQGYYASNSGESGKFNLQQIDHQLQESRKLYPS